MLLSTLSAAVRCSLNLRGDMCPSNRNTFHHFCTCSVVECGLHGRRTPNQMGNHSVSPVVMVLAWFQRLHHHCWHFLDSQVSILSSFMHFKLLLPYDPSMIQLSNCHSAHRYPFEFPKSMHISHKESPTAPHITTAQNSASPALNAVKFCNVEPVFTMWPPTCAEIAVHIDRYVLDVSLPSESNCCTWLPDKISCDSFQRVEMAFSVFSHSLHHTRGCISDVKRFLGKVRQSCAS